MGQSTDGQISFGVSFPDGHEFPWDESPHDGDIESWWRAINGYVPPFELYDKDGEYLDGKKPGEQKSNEYYNHRRDWLQKNPVPVELVNSCSLDYPRYIVAIPRTVKTANRGGPETFDPAALTVTDAERIPFEEFIRTHCDPDAVDSEEFDPKPAWYLSSYWG